MRFWTSNQIKNHLKLLSGVGLTCVLGCSQQSLWLQPEKTPVFNTAMNNQKIHYLDVQKHQNKIHAPVEGIQQVAYERVDEREDKESEAKLELSPAPTPPPLSMHRSVPAKLVSAANAIALDQQKYEGSQDEPVALKSPQNKNAAEPVEAEATVIEQLEKPADQTVQPALPMATESPNQQPLIDQVQIAASIHASFPLLQSAYLENQVAYGELIARAGEFDTKLKAESRNQPLGFYNTFRNSAGFETPLYQGGSVFGGYRIGRGDFEPWYGERETNDGGEFKAGVQVPLVRNRDIDARRAALWRAQYERQRVVPEIQAQLIQFVRDGSFIFWECVAAKRRLEISERALKLANDRNNGLIRRKQLGAIGNPVLKDNRRTIAKRESKVVDLRRKLQQSLTKLALYYRSTDGAPQVIDVSRLPDFPGIARWSDAKIDQEIAAAFSSRPELAMLDAEIRQVEVDFAEAQNETLPRVDAHLIGSEDVGAPTSSKSDKSQFELEGGFQFDMPVQRRKGQGKMIKARAKLAQLGQYRRFTIDKIDNEIQNALLAVQAALGRLEFATESRELAEAMAQIERRKEEEGASGLLQVVIREQDAIESAEAEVDAYLEYFLGVAAYRAAIARDWPVDR